MANWAEVDREWLKQQPAGVRQAALAVLHRMHGCADAQCYACTTNRELVEDLVDVVTRAAHGEGKV